MKIVIPGIDENALGGGWSFVRNFRKAMGDKVIAEYDKADIFFIPSASMVSRDEVSKAKEDGKKIVLRCDNIIRNSRNRNTGMGRMKDFSEWADLTIFQSEFAEDLLNPYLRTENFKVILNSIDESIFNENGRVDTDLHRYFYAKHSSDETKNWEMARVAFQLLFERNKDSIFNIVGRFDGNLEEYNFDYYNGEQYKYWGYITDPNVMAHIYRESDTFIYTYFNDACSNTLIEALCCGVDVLDPYTMARTGGTAEIEDMFYHEGVDYFKLERMGKEYKEAMEKL